jgi:hypothetical protein
MNNKKVTIICLVLAAIILIIICASKFVSRESTSNIIPSGYICVFNGGSGEVTYSTYIYKNKKYSDNYGFDYINTTNTTKSWGSSEWNQKITSRGTAGWTDEVFEVARKNNAYSYVIENGKKYSIEEYMNRFLMD